MTETESLLAQKQELFILEKMLTNKQLTLSEIELVLPALFHVNSMKDSSLVYLSEKGANFLGYEKEEIMPFSAEQLATIVTEDTLTHITPRFVEFYQEEDHYKVLSAFQQINQKGKEGYEWVYTTTKIYKGLNAPISLSIPVKQMGQLSQQLTGLLEDNLFIKKHYQKFASLTKQEREILKLVVMGVRRQHISDQLHISIHTYDTHRKNIRRKLETKSLGELIRYAQAFGLFEE